ncbi:hypothetical protein EIN_222380 [Entamoeba invadens IP1]|uniref:VHS domain-containing protein n=1 Tax=Entamoeba invadens IP1 TaxID=370355 RepID=A0A0A1U5H8_ENTIV|nr:hypothetical protein EIN_222380 [Entamoeba invadens IP1]ELP88095.1 hypothetical protein EIN_222380 [Entamoeba invadens IP1]|eukprot:XP_004254866.1 hypothetical protein EIN_222380 [Entamoeba invadens IP1]
MSVKLSDLVNAAGDDAKDSPTQTEMQTILSVIEKITSADHILRNQIEDKMKLYDAKKISDVQMCNILTLADYIVQNSPLFRTQVANLSFIALLQSIGKMKKQFGSVNTVEAKVRELIYKWGTYFPNELSEYVVLRQKYCKNGVIDPNTTSTVFLPTSLTSLIPHVEHTLRKASTYFETGVGDINSIKRHAEKLYTKYKVECEYCRRMSSRYDAKLLKEADEIGKRLETVIKKCDDEITGSKKINVTNFVSLNKDDVKTAPRKTTLHLQPPPMSPQTRSIVSPSTFYGNSAFTKRESPFEASSYTGNSFVYTHKASPSPLQTAKATQIMVPIAQPNTGDIFAFDEDLPTKPPTSSLNPQAQQPSFL